MNIKICDVERFRKSEDEVMTKKGMWVTYTKTSNLKPLKMVTQSHKLEILEKYYDKHHKQFYKKVASILKQYNKCLIIDCHSFSSKPLPYELNQDYDRPDICIGTDDYHTPKKLVNMLEQLFIKRGYKVAINKPFSGTIVPIDYYQNNKNVQSIMIEINRGIYMNETTSAKTSNYDKVKKDLIAIISSIIKI